MRPKGEVFVSVEVSGFFWTSVDVPLLTLGIRCICPGLGFGGDGECPFFPHHCLLPGHFLVCPSSWWCLLRQLLYSRLSAEVCLSYGWM